MFYQDMAAVASELLQEFGQLIELTQYGNEVYLDGENTLTETRYRAWGAAFAYAIDEVDGERILNGDMRVLLERSQAVPEVGDTVAVNGHDWRVVSVEAVSPAGFDVIYKLQVRR